MDKYDIPYLIKDIESKMPYHTDSTAKVPHSFSMGMPKSLIEESHKVDNKFLNKHLGEIEEAIDKKFVNGESFITQQRQYHLESGILNHDNVFHADLATGTPMGIDNFKHYPFIMNPSRFGGCVGGADIQVAGTANDTHTSLNTLYGAKITGAEAGKCYNEIAIDCVTAVANKRMANYTDNSGSPTDLISETASVAQTADYAFVSMPEWTQDGTTNVWCAYNNNSISNVVNNLQGGSRKYKGSVTFGTMPDPFTAGYSGDTYPHKQKIGHS